MKVHFATTNQHKIQELQAIARLLDANCEVLSMKFEGTEPEENGSTFQENAQIKFNFYKKHFKGEGILATEDSGLEVHCLENGFPSINSAPYLKSFSSKKACFDDLHSRIKGKGSEASFVCNICTEINGTIYHFEEKCEGTLAFDFQEEDSFGFDSIFIPNNYTQTFHQLKEETKHTLSHRGKAFKKFLNFAI